MGRKLRILLKIWGLKKVAIIPFKLSFRFRVEKLFNFPISVYRSLQNVIFSIIKPGPPSLEAMKSKEKENCGWPLPVYCLSLCVAVICHNYGMSLCSPLTMKCLLRQHFSHKLQPTVYCRLCFISRNSTHNRLQTRNILRDLYICKVKVRKSIKMNRRTYLTTYTYLPHPRIGEFEYLANSET